MTEKILKGQRFAFSQPTTAIAVSSPFGGYLGFHAPGNEIRKKYRPDLLGEEIQISTSDEFIAHKTYVSVTGWCVVGHRAEARHDGIIEVHFHQKLSDDDDPKEFIEIEMK